MTARIWVEAVAHTAEGERRFIVRGQTAKGLIALVNGWRLRRDSHGGGELGIQVRGLLPPTSHAVRARDPHGARRPPWRMAWPTRLGNACADRVRRRSRAKSRRSMNGRENHDASMEEKAKLQAMGFEPTPVLKAIRAKCLDCSGGMPSEVRDCLVPDCALFPFRFGKNPWRAPPTEARREAARKAVASLNKPGTIPGFDATDGVAATTLPDSADATKSGVVGAA